MRMAERVLADGSSGPRVVVGAPLRHDREPPVDHERHAGDERRVRPDEEYHGPPDVVLCVTIALDRPLRQLLLLPLGMELEVRLGLGRARLWAQRVDADAQGPPLISCDLREPSDPLLRRGVAGESRQPVGACRRDDVHDRPAARREERLAPSHEAEGAPEPSRKGQLEVSVGMVDERETRDHGLGAVDEDLQVSVGGYRGVARLGGSGLEPDVADDRRARDAVTPDLGRGGIRQVALHVDEDDVRTLLGQRLDDPPADALRPAGDDGDLSFEYPHRVLRSAESPRRREYLNGEPGVVSMTTRQACRRVAAMRARRARRAAGLMTRRVSWCDKRRAGGWR